MTAAVHQVIAVANILISRGGSASQPPRFWVLAREDLTTVEEPVLE